MSPRILFGLAVALLLVGSITLTHEPRTSSSTSREVEVGLGKLSATSSGGLNASAGTATVTGVLVSLRTNVLWLNNTNATGDWFARLAIVNTTGLGNLASLVVGIDNGTSTPMVLGSLGTLTQTTGPLVRLAPASANRIYLTQAVNVLTTTSTLTLDVIVADAADEAATVTTSLSLTIT